MSLKTKRIVHGPYHGLSYAQVIKAYAEAVQTVDPVKADGKPHTLWVAFSRYYEDNDDLDSARDILERATQVGDVKTRAGCSTRTLLFAR